VGGRPFPLARVTEPAVEASGLTIGLPAGGPPVLQLLSERGINASIDGNWARMLCPLHEEDTPSMGIQLNDGYYNCFGCGAKGDFVTLVCKLYDVDALSAFSIISRLKRGEIEPHLERQAVLGMSHERRNECGVDEAWSSFKKIDWWSLPKIHPIIQYFVKERELHRATLEAFDVRLANSADYPVVFPIRMGSEFVGYVKRRITEGKKKYLYNSGFEAEKCLAYYCTNHKAPCLIVEGIIDHLKAAQFGWEHCAALLSWKLKPAQEEWLKKHRVREVVCALDNPAISPTGKKGLGLLKNAFGSVRSFKYPGAFRKDIADLNVNEFWAGMPDYEED